MQFTITTRDGPGRIGQLTIQKKTITTPTLLYVDTSKIKAPDFAEILITNNKIPTTKPFFQIGNSIFSQEKNNAKNKEFIQDYLLYPKDVSRELHTYAIQHNKKTHHSWCIIPSQEESIDKALQNNDASLLIISYAFQLYSQQSACVRFLTTLREKAGYQKILYLPSIGNPQNLAFFTYLGIDVFDSISALIAARRKTLLFPDGQYNIEDIHESICNCPACSKIKSEPSKMTFSQIAHHNYFTMNTEIKRVRNAIRTGQLRELVEARVATNPSLTAMLKIGDQQFSHFFEERTPISRPSKLLATTKHSLHRIEITRFQQRVLSQYNKPPSAKILLLLPCSAKKPYSFSKTHKHYIQRINMLHNPSIIHEVILTSPLGIVPRELELIYPAAQYDIDVSGQWSNDEQTMIQQLLQHYLKQWKYDTCIVHVPPSIQEFIIPLLKNPIITCKDSPTSKESLDELSSMLEQNTQSYQKIDRKQRTLENITSLASYQFGRKTAEQLVNNCIVRGKYPYQKLINNNNQLGMVTKDRGMISLTLGGAAILAKSKTYWVEIHDDFSLIGSVFAPGVKDADEQIRIGDEVVVLSNGVICGVGVAQMNGKEMKQLQHGEAVKIRHKKPNISSS